VQRGNIRTTQALLQAGADIKLADEQGKMTLLERATKHRFSTPLLCKVLIEYGAQANRPISTQKHDSSALLNALEQNSPELVELLISAGARPNDEYSKRRYTALGAAVEHGDEVLINILSAAGAAFVGTRLQEIGNLCTAMYLQESGVLQAFLRVSGPVILAAALSAKKADLTEYLLEHNADYEGLMDNEDPPLFEQTPLEAAIGAENFILTEKLLERGANVTDVALGCAKHRSCISATLTVQVSWKCPEHSRNRNLAQCIPTTASTASGGRSGSHWGTRGLPEYWRLFQS
jgi:ankyrin repeat protein